MISVILPVYNAEKYLEASINSILNQSCKRLDLIICDDNSTDSSTKIIQKYRDPRIVIIKNETNIGYLKSINKLLKLCRNELIAFQDADDISHPQRLELQSDYLNKSGLDITGTNYALITKSNKILRKVNVESRENKLKQLIQSQNPFMKPSIMFKKHVYDQIGGFREQLAKFNIISEDYDWLLRASLLFHLGNLNHKDPLYFYRSSPKAMSKNFNTIDQLFGHEICQYLYKQRVLTGTDDIDNSNYSRIRELIDRLKIPYLEDPSKYYTERAESLMYFGLQNQAIIHALKGVAKNFNFRNLRTLQYCLRKSIFKI